MSSNLVRNNSIILSQKAEANTSQMTCRQPYRPSPTCPHTYGVRHWPHSAIATEPCRPTACVHERPCSPNWEGDSALILNSSFLIPNWTFTFSAKEKDSETGLSYFGSRYYSSDLSIWLSVDPMSDKYASLSPYTYCANNPVKLVDPNGEAWEVNQDGYIRETGDKDDHTLYVVKGKGEEFGDRVTYRFGKQKGMEKSIPVSSEVMEKMVFDKSKDWDGLSRSYIEHDYTQLEFSGNAGVEDAKKLICFLSKNTDVEWSIVGGSFNDIISTTIYSSHKNNREYMGLNRAISISANNNLYFFFHSHPRNEIFGWMSNGNDRNACRGLLVDYNSPNAQVGVIHKGMFFDFHGMRVAKKNIW